MYDASVTPWTVAHQAPLFMGFPRQEYWSRLPFPPPGHLLNPGLLHWQVDYLPVRHLGSPGMLWLCVHIHPQLIPDQVLLKFLVKTETCPYLDYFFCPTIMGSPVSLGIRRVSSGETVPYTPAIRESTPIMSLISTWKTPTYLYESAQRTVLIQCFPDWLCHSSVKLVTPQMCNHSVFLHLTQCRDPFTGFLSLSPRLILDLVVLCCGKVLGIVECSAASLASGQ